ncbi:helix-turn-helix transcriptional regulator, partial [Streptomyces sp. MBT49]|uniref:helix-turn-helix transcriptional regulator n=1 Tax=Streptomyces sp. MBT49 TaxID=1488380 RepID=UPI0035ABDD70
MEFALLHADPDDANWLRPVPPSIALSQLLNPIEHEITRRRRLSVELADAFEPFMTLSAQPTPTTHSITVLEGIDRINAALDLATSQCQTEMLTVQPSRRRLEHTLVQGLERDRPLIDRGCRIRTLYQHTARYSPETLGYVSQFTDGKVEYRTIDELVERLIICDETVAFIPTRDDGQVALELRHPGLVRYLIKVFEFMWGRAVPLATGAPYETAPDGITDIQHSIAKLLVEGHVDEELGD